MAAMDRRTFQNPTSWWDPGSVSCGVRGKWPLGDPSGSRCRHKLEPFLQNQVHGRVILEKGRYVFGMGCRREAGANVKWSEERTESASIRGFGIADVSGQNASSVPSCRVHAANNGAAQKGWWEQRGNDSTGLHASDVRNRIVSAGAGAGAGREEEIYVWTRREDVIGESHPKAPMADWRAEGADLETGSRPLGGWSGKDRSYVKERKEET